MKDFSNDILMIYIGKAVHYIEFHLQLNSSFDQAPCREMITFWVCPFIKLIHTAESTLKHPRHIVQIESVNFHESYVADV